MAKHTRKHKATAREKKENSEKDISMGLCKIRKVFESILPQAALGLKF